MPFNDGCFKGMWSDKYKVRFEPQGYSLLAVY